MTNKKTDQTPKKSTPDNEGANYQVLARKYRPTNFSGLIGQDAMVRTLTNAFDAERLAHAFILSGVRGVGKTTTARIIAKALNCVGEDGNGKPTINPCGKCEMCLAIAEDRHLDVFEMDAASRTGVDDIRELIDAVRYKPVSARYKVYIIDEVHMLSRNAFNALLKTLEEPPEHVKFVFATTEIRKVPVTVLSRCQRFDLRRVNVETLIRHFAEIVEKEGALISEQGLALIARVSDGSVRDGQSLLDQIVTTGRREEKEIGEGDVREILGLADRERTFDLLEKVLKGEIEVALEIVQKDYINGSDPLSTLQDLAELVHWLTRIKVAPKTLEDLTVSESERSRGKDLSGKLSMANLGRAWQMIVKGLKEVQTSLTPIQAVEMILVRLAYLSDLPSPNDVIRNLEKYRDHPEGAVTPTNDQNKSNPSTLSSNTSGPRGLAFELEEQPEKQTLSNFKLNNFEQVIALLDDHGERILMADLVNNVHLVSFEPGKIEVCLAEAANPDTPKRLYSFLNSVMEERWSVSLATQGGNPTLREQKREEERALHVEIKQGSLMQSVMENFPGAEIETIRQIDDKDFTTPEEKKSGGEKIT